MKCLAVNTANTLLSLALLDGEKVLDVFETSETRNQGNLLLQHIQSALRKSKMTFADLDLLAVATGPGSFTGIRIGLAAMRAIALAAQKPIVGISSFDIFTAQDCREKSNIVALQSWREELYLRTDDGAPVNVAPQDFVKSLKKKSGIVLTGDAAELVQPFLPEAEVQNLKESSSVILARLAMRRFSKEGAGDKPVPFYLREADVTLSANTRKVENG